MPTEPGRWSKFCSVLFTGAPHRLNFSKATTAKDRLVARTRRQVRRLELHVISATKARSRTSDERRLFDILLGFTLISSDIHELPHCCSKLACRPPQGRLCPQTRNQLHWRFAACVKGMTDWAGTEKERGWMSENGGEHRLRSWRFANHNLGGERAASGTGNLIVPDADTTILPLRRASGTYHGVARESSAIATTLVHRSAWCGRGRRLGSAVVSFT